MQADSFNAVAGASLPSGLLGPHIHPVTHGILRIWSVDPVHVDQEVERMRKLLFVVGRNTLGAFQ